MREAALKQVLEQIEKHAGPTPLKLNVKTINKEQAELLVNALILKFDLQVLDLSENEIGDEVATVLSKILIHHFTLHTLDLRNNQIGYQGTRALASALIHNFTLITLNLDNNQIGDWGAEAISNALIHNDSLTTLTLRNNEIGNWGAQAIGKTLFHNSSLITLTLNNNKIGNWGARLIANHLVPNTTLLTLDLSDNSISGAYATKINPFMDRLLARNRKIQERIQTRLELNWGGVAVLTASGKANLRDPYKNAILTLINNSIFPFMRSKTENADSSSINNNLPPNSIPNRVPLTNFDSFIDTQYHRSHLINHQPIKKENQSPVGVKKHYAARNHLTWAITHLDITIRYAGPTNIENTLLTERVPNYWTNGDCTAQARNNTGIHETINFYKPRDSTEDTSCGHQLFSLLGDITCMCCFTSPHYAKDVEEKRNKLNAEIRRLSGVRINRISQDIANMFRAADDLVDLRIAIVDQRTALQVQQQFSRHSGSALTMQYLTSLKNKSATPVIESTDNVAATHSAVTKSVLPYTPQTRNLLTCTRVTTSSDINITIRYEGSVNIGERRILTKEIPNYWTRDADFIAQASDNTGIHKDFRKNYDNYSDDFFSNSLCMLCQCVGCISCLCCFINPFFNHDVKNKRNEFKQARETLNAEIQRFADNKMSREITRMFETADDLVDQRIAKRKLRQLPPNTGSQNQSEEEEVKSRLEQFHRANMFKAADDLVDQRIANIKIQQLSPSIGMQDQSAAAAAYSPLNSDPLLFSSKNQLPLNSYSANNLGFSIPLKRPSLLSNDLLILAKEKLRNALTLLFSPKYIDATSYCLSRPILFSSHSNHFEENILQSLRLSKELLPIKQQVDTLEMLGLLESKDVHSIVSTVKDIPLQSIAGLEALYYQQSIVSAAGFAAIAAVIGSESWIKSYVRIALASDFSQLPPKDSEEALNSVSAVIAAAVFDAITQLTPMSHEAYLENFASVSAKFPQLTLTPSRESIGDIVSALKDFPGSFTAAAVSEAVTQLTSTDREAWINRLASAIADAAELPQLNTQAGRGLIGNIVSAFATATTVAQSTPNLYRLPLQLRWNVVDDKTTPKTSSRIRM